MAASRSGGLKPCGPGSPFQSIRPSLPIKIEAVGPSGIIELDAVVEVVDHGFEFDSEIADAGSSVVLLFVESLGGFEKNAGAKVGVGLPAVGWMGFPDIDEQEFHLALVFFRH